MGIQNIETNEKTIDNMLKNMEECHKTMTLTLAFLMHLSA